MHNETKQKHYIQ